MRKRLSKLTLEQKAPAAGRIEIRKLGEPTRVWTHQEGAFGL